MALPCVVVGRVNQHKHAEDPRQSGALKTPFPANADLVLCINDYFVTDVKNVVFLPRIPGEEVTRFHAVALCD